MATLSPLSSSTTIPTTSSPRHHCFCSRNTVSLNSNSPFVFGFSLSLSNSRPTSLPLSANRSSSFLVRCQKEETEKENKEIDKETEKKKKKKDKIVPYVPLDQRWLFEEHEINGPDIWNATWYPKARDHVNTEKPWYVVDATDKVLGRLASTIAIYIRGKNLAIYTPSVDMGAFVIVVNAEKVAVSGKKRTQKLYRRHSGRPGGMKVETFDQLQQRIPERIIEHSVRGMLPKGRLYNGTLLNATEVDLLDLMEQEVEESPKGCHALYCIFGRYAFHRSIVECHSASKPIDTAEGVRYLCEKLYRTAYTGTYFPAHDNSKLGRALFNHLKVYKGPDHPHESQKPVELPIRDKRIQRQR